MRISVPSAAAFFMLQRWWHYNGTMKGTVRSPSTLLRPSLHRALPTFQMCIVEARAYALLCTAKLARLRGAPPLTSKRARRHSVRAGAFLVRPVMLRLCTAALPS